MLSAMNYEDFRDPTETVRSRLDEEEDLSDDQYNANFGNDRTFHSSNLDETPEIASEVTVGKDVDNKYDLKKERAPRSPKSKTDVYQQISATKCNILSNPTWTSWARQQRGRRRSSSSPSVGGSGRKKYICEKCNDVFTRSAELRVHRDTMHAGEKKYKCKDCGKLFSQKGSLNRHMAQVPHGEFKYRCPRCGQIFVYKEYLMTHLKFSIHCVKSPVYEEQCNSNTMMHSSTFLSSLSEGGESSYSPTYRSGPPGLRPGSYSNTYPRQRMYSKLPPGLRIPPHS